MEKVYCGCRQGSYPTRRHKVTRYLRVYLAMRIDSNPTTSVPPALTTSSVNGVPSDTATQQALDVFCGSSEQNYEQFMNAFTYLTAADIAAHAARTAVISVTAVPLGDLQTSDDNGLGGNDCCTVEQSDTHLMSGVVEEVLPEGTRAKDIFLRDTSSVGGCTLKVDNFLDATSDDDDDDDCSSLSDDETSPHTVGYTASFSHNTPDDLSRLAETRNLKGDDTSRHEDVYINLQKCDNDDSEQELSYDVRYDLPNPGEVETFDPCDLTANVNIRQLDFSGKTATGLSREQAAHEADTDEVEIFQLEEGFDYDNVTLTPKFTATQMLQLAAYQQNTSQSTRPVDGDGDTDEDEGSNIEPGHVG